MGYLRFHDWARLHDRLEVPPIALWISQSNAGQESPRLSMLIVLTDHIHDEQSKDGELSEVFGKREEDQWDYSDWNGSWNGGRKVRPVAES